MTMVPIPSTFRQQHHDGGGAAGAGGGGGGGGGACGDYCDTGTGGKFCRLMSRIGASEYEYDYDPCSEACVGSDQVGFGIGHNHMAEDESRTRSRNEAGSSKGGGPGGGAFHQEKQEEPRDDEGSWLQLGIGSSGGRGCRTEPTKLEDPIEPTGTRRPGSVELDLKPPGGCSGGGSSTSSADAQEMVVNKASDPIFSMKEFRASCPPSTTAPPPPPLFLLQYQHPNAQPRPAASSLTSLIFPHQSEVDWGYNRAPNPNLPWTPSPSSPSSSSATPASSSMLPVGPYYSRLFQLPSLDVAGPGPSSSSSSDVVRVIDAPPRPHSGVWFVLEASQNQAKEPFLPQIPKSFLRIKDGRMTVHLLMKYLVNKLRLDNESEVEITCRGQQLLPLFTLQHVRDKIWSRRRDAVSLVPDSSTTATTTTTTTTDHLVMILHYGRTA